MTEQPDALFHVDEQAPAGCLKWLRPEDGPDEVIPAARGLYYEHCIDDTGAVYPSVVLRRDDGEPLAGVRLSTEELMSFAMWSFQNALAHEKFWAESVNGTLMRGYVTEKLKILLDFVREQVPGSYVDLIAADQKAVNDKVIAAAVREIAAQKLQLARGYKALERRHARAIVQLSRCATLQTPAEREEALADPLLQQVICRAVECVADSDGKK